MFRLLLSILGFMLLWPANAQISVSQFRELIGEQPASAIIRPGSLIYGQAVFPVAANEVETPVFTRLLAVAAICFWQVHAACHEKALSIFGTRDKISDEWCTEDSKALMSGLIILKVLHTDYSFDMDSFSNLLRVFNVEVDSSSTDTSTVPGWANFHSGRIIRYLTSDGWNSIGNATRHTFLQKFADTTRYKPVNGPYAEPRRLRYPLRWQSISFDADNRGKFYTPVHVTPHVGFIGKPYVISRSDSKSRKVKSPYHHPNSKYRIQYSDVCIANSYIDELLHISRNLSFRQRVLAHWWDVKLFSLGQISLSYIQTLNLSSFEVYRLLMGESLSEHDAILLAWKEKVRHDLIRPQTLIRRLRKNEVAETFVSEEQGVQPVHLSEWESIVKVMPHSEFPSGSAALCTAAMDHLELLLQEYIGNSTIPPFQFTIVPALVPSFPLKEPLDVKFKTLQDAARSCGQSRLWAGVHFSPSIKAGNDVVSGVGKAAYDHMKMLSSGIVPPDCERCGKY